MPGFEPRPGELERDALPPDALRADVARRLGPVLRAWPAERFDALVDQIVRTTLRWRGPLPLPGTPLPGVDLAPLPPVLAPEDRLPAAPAAGAPVPIPGPWGTHALGEAGHLRLPPAFRPGDPSPSPTGEAFEWFATGPLAEPPPTWHFAEEDPDVTRDAVPPTAPAPRAVDADDAIEYLRHVLLTATRRPTRDEDVWTPPEFTEAVEVSWADLRVGGRALRVTAGRFRVADAYWPHGAPDWYWVVAWWALEDGTWLEFRGASGLREGQEGVLAALHTLQPVGDSAGVPPRGA
jgi:hypothetical protein